MENKLFKEIKRIILLLIVVICINIINVDFVRADTFKLKSFEIKTKELTQGEKIYYDIKYDGKTNFIGIWAKETTTNEAFYISTSNLENNYFDLAEENGTTHNGTGTFQLVGVVFGLEDKVIYYSTDECAENESEDCVKYDFSNINFTIKEKQKKEEDDDIGIFDYVLTINEQKAYVGEKIYVNFGSPESFNGKEIKEKPLSSVMLSFTNQNDGNILNVYLKSLEKNPYFIIPSTTTPGQYTINYGYLTFTDGTSEKYQNKPGKVFSYEGIFEVKEKEIDKNNYTFNSENYNQKVKDDLEKLNSNAIITVNANNSPIIYKELFESIKSTNKTLIIEYQNMTWIFNGKDITNPKTIEVSIKLGKLDTKDISKTLANRINSKSALLEFTNNGELPGKALIKLDSKNIEEYIDSEVLYVYYYDEETNKVSKVAMEVQKNNGFFEFYINHNSKYILTSKEIKENNNKNDISDYKTKKNNYILYVCIGISVLIIVVAIVLLLKKRKLKKSKKSNAPSEE